MLLNFGNQHFICGFIVKQNGAVLLLQAGAQRSVRLFIRLMHRHMAAVPCAVHPGDEFFAEFLVDAAENVVCEAQKPRVVQIGQQTDHL